jgi:hypothetical protein
VFQVWEGGHLTINDNVAAGNDSSYAIYVDSGVEAGVDAQVNRNTISDTEPLNSYSGIYFDSTGVGSTSQFCNNDIAGAVNGLYLENLSTDGGLVDICHNKVDSFSFGGIVAPSGSNDGGKNSIVGNELIGDTEANFGIDLGLLSSSAVTDIESNRIDMIEGAAGIRLHSVTFGSTTNIHNNVLEVTDVTYGVHVSASNIENAAEFNVTQNEITGYEGDGILVEFGVVSSKVLIENNILIGAGTTSGVQFGDVVSGGSQVNIVHNCISASVTGVITGDVYNDTSVMHINQNDLSGQPTAINGTASTKTVDGENNYLGTAVVVGNVDSTPSLGSPPSCSGATATPTHTVSPTPSPTGSVTVTPVVCGTGTATASPTLSPTPLITFTPGPAPTARPTRTPASTSTLPPGTATPVGTATGTATATATPSATPSATPCASVAAVTATPSPTVTPTPSPTPTQSPPPTATPVITPPPTVNPNAPTARPTRTPTS